MTNTQSKRYYKRSSGQKRAYDKQNMYHPSTETHSIGKPMSKRKRQQLAKQAKRRQARKQVNVDAMICEHSIYHERKSGYHALARAYQMAVETNKKVKHNE